MGVSGRLVSPVPAQYLLEDTALSHLDNAAPRRYANHTVCVFLSLCKQGKAAAYYTLQARMS